MIEIIELKNPMKLWDFFFKLLPKHKVHRVYTQNIGDKHLRNIFLFVNGRDQLLSDHDFIYVHQIMTDLQMSIHKNLN